MMMMKRHYREGDACRESSWEVNNVKDQKMQDAHDVGGETQNWFLVGERCGIMQTIVVGR